MKRRFLVYADKMFAASESFIHRSYQAFDELEPVFIGSELRNPPPPGLSAIELGDFHGLLGETGFKQFARVSEPLKTRLLEEKPILIHAHFGKSGAYALPLAHELGLPLVATYHGGDATKIANTSDNAFRVYNRRRAQLWADAALILPVSDFIRRELETHGCPPEKMIVHYNGVDPARFNPAPKQKIILFAGRWIEKKGIDTLIKALARLGPRLDGWRVRLIGDGDLKPALVTQLEAAGVQAELPGWVPADDMPKHFAEAMIHCVPSKRAKSGDAEGLPMVCIEAMLSGCAVAATRHAGIPECVKDGETGYLVDEGDDEALAEKLGQMIADPAATQAMGMAGRALALTDFNLNIQSKRLQAHLERVARAAGTLTSSIPTVRRPSGETSMRVVHVMAGAAEGGAENIMMESVVALAGAGVAQAVVTRGENTFRIGRMRAAGVKVAVADFNKGWPFPTQSAIAHMLKTFKPDIVQFWMGRAGLFAPAKWRTRSIGWYGGYYKLERFANCDWHVGLTSDLLRHIREHGVPEDRSGIIHTYADFTGDAPVDRADFDTPADAPVALALARLHWKKGLDTLLDAAAQVPGLYVWIAGEGPIETELKAQASRLGLDDRVRFLGWRNDRGALLAASTFVAFPSRYEPFGTVTVDAWAAGKPLIAADAVGPAAYVEDGVSGLVVPKDDAAALALAMRRVITEPGLNERLVTGGRAAFGRHFTRDVFVRDSLDFYRRVITASPDFDAGT